jgi:hypothetical protein
MRDHIQCEARHGECREEYDEECQSRNPAHMQPPKPFIEGSVLCVGEVGQPVVQPVEHADARKQGETFGSRDEQQQDSRDYERPCLSREQHP